MTFYVGTTMIKGCQFFEADTFQRCVFWLFDNRETLTNMYRYGTPNFYIWTVHPFFAHELVECGHYTKEDVAGYRISGFVKNPYYFGFCGL